MIFPLSEYFNDPRFDYQEDLKFEEQWERDHLHLLEDLAPKPPTDPELEKQYEKNNDKLNNGSNQKRTKGRHAGLLRTKSGDRESHKSSQPERDDRGPEGGGRKRP